MRTRSIVGAAVALVGLGAVAVSTSTWAPTAVPAHTQVTQMTWVGPHPDTSVDAPTGPQETYVIDVKKDTITYLGTRTRT